VIYDWLKALCSIGKKDKAVLAIVVKTMLTADAV
jgi:hypothetical protein